MAQHKFRIIEDTLTGASKDLSKCLDCFYPAYNRNGFNERNLPFYFAKYFCSENNGHAFMEIPYINKKTGILSNRIDCLVYNSKIAIFIESKRLYNKIKSEEIAKDINRLGVGNIRYILKKLPITPKPKRIFSLILAETWQQKQKNVLEWWMTGRSKRLSWSRKGYPTDWLYSNLTVKEYEKSTLYWLYAYKELKM